jgi:hypothetical protein
MDAKESIISLWTRSESLPKNSGISLGCDLLGFASCSLEYRILFGLLDLEEGIVMLSRNFDKYLPTYSVQHPKRAKASIHNAPETQNLANNYFFQ